MHIVAVQLRQPASVQRLRHRADLRYLEHHRVCRTHCDGLAQALWVGGEQVISDDLDAQLLDGQSVPFQVPLMQGILQ